MKDSARTVTSFVSAIVTLSSPLVSIITEFNVVSFTETDRFFVEISSQILLNQTGMNIILELFLPDDTDNSYQLLFKLYAYISKLYIGANHVFYLNLFSTKPYQHVALIPCGHLPVIFTSKIMMQVLILHFSIY